MNPPARYGEIEVGIHRTLSSVYEVEIRVTDPDSQAEKAPIRRQAKIDLDKLRILELSPKAYGEALAGQLFSHPDTLDFYKKNKVAFDAKKSAATIHGHT